MLARESVHEIAVGYGCPDYAAVKDLGFLAGVEALDLFLAVLVDVADGQAAHGRTLPRLVKLVDGAQPEFQIPGGNNFRPLVLKREGNFRQIIAGGKSVSFADFDGVAPLSAETERPVEGAFLAGEGKVSPLVVAVAAYPQRKLVFRGFLADRDVRFLDDVALEKLDPDQVAKGLVVSAAQETVAEDRGAFLTVIADGRPGAKRAAGGSRGRLNGGCRRAANVRGLLLLLPHLGEKQNEDKAEQSHTYQSISIHMLSIFVFRVRDRLPRD